MALPTLQAPRYPAAINVGKVAIAEPKNAAILTAGSAVVAQTPAAPTFQLANVNTSADFP